MQLENGFLFSRISHESGEVPPPTEEPGRGETHPSRGSHALRGRMWLWSNSAELSVEHFAGFRVEPIYCTHPSCFSYTYIVQILVYVASSPSIVPTPAATFTPISCSTPSPPTLGGMIYHGHRGEGHDRKESEDNFGHEDSICDRSQEDVEQSGMGDE